MGISEYEYIIRKATDVSYSACQPTIPENTFGNSFKIPIIISLPHFFTSPLLTCHAEVKHAAYFQIFSKRTHSQARPEIPQIRRNCNGEEGRLGALGDKLST